MRLTKKIKVKKWGVASSKTLQPPQLYFSSTDYFSFKAVSSLSPTIGRQNFEKENGAQ
jgi:hypothetical protein